MLDPDNLCQSAPPTLPTVHQLPDEDDPVTYPIRVLTPGNVREFIDSLFPDEASSEDSETAHDE